MKCNNHFFTHKHASNFNDHKSGEPIKMDTDGPKTQRIMKQPQTVISTKLN